MCPPPRLTGRPRSRFLSTLRAGPRRARWERREAAFAPARGKADDLLIDGELVAGQGRIESVLDPVTGEVIALVPEASLEQVSAAVAAADRAFVSWKRTTPKDRSSLLLELANRLEARAPELARLESLNCGKPYPLALGDEMPAVVDVLRFFAGAARSPTGLARGRVRRRAHQHDPPRSAGRGRVDRALELPADDGGVEDRSGPRGGQHRGPQAVRADAADHARARRDHRRALPAGRRQHRHRTRGVGRAPAQPPSRRCG